MRTILVLWAALASCGGFQYTGTMRGYCFQASGMKEQCFATNPDCLSHERYLIEERPWNVIERGCQLEFYR